MPEWTDPRGRRLTYHAIAPDPHYARGARTGLGLGLGGFEKLLASQDGKCAICQETLGRPCVDHDHATGEIRGVLCDACNKGLGFFRDKSASLRAAADYLDSHEIMLKFGRAVDVGQGVMPRHPRRGRPRKNKGL